ncbi:hypothetical protein AB0758_41905 [Tolypothrix bouteillei VB521301_2]
MMLKLPIEIELEVMGIPPSQAQEIEENLNLNEKSEYQVVVSGMNLAKIEDSQTFLSQIVEQLQEENKLFSTISQVKLEENNTTSMEEKSLILKDKSAKTLSYSQDCTTIPNQTLLPQKKCRFRFSESLNDSMTFALNSMGAILFLGKLANYSWE